MAYSQSLVVVLCLLAWSAGTLKACASPAVTACTNTYLASLTGNFITQRELYCRVLNEYNACVEKVCGSVPQDIKDYITQTQTHYFTCVIGGSPVSATLSPVLLLSTIVAATILQPFGVLGLL